MPTAHPSDGRFCSRVKATLLLFAQSRSERGLYATLARGLNGESALPTIGATTREEPQMRVWSVSAALSVLAASVFVASSAAAGSGAGRAGQSQPTAILVRAVDPPRYVRADDRRKHIEYDLVVTNDFQADVTLRSLVVRTGGRKLLTLKGESLAAHTHALGAAEPTRTIPGASSVAILVDLAIPARHPVPEHLGNHVRYALGPTPLTPAIGSYTVHRRLRVERRKPLVIPPPLRGPGWMDGNSCCNPNAPHRNLLLPANGRLNPIETFAIDWLRMRGGVWFHGDGQALGDYPGYGAKIHSVAAGTVVAAVDGRPEAPINYPSIAPFVHSPDGFPGNHVIVKIRPAKYAVYAHMQPGSVRVQPGQQVRSGEVLGLLGNSGNSTTPHLHFSIQNGPHPLASSSLPFVIDRFRFVGHASEGPTPLQITLTGKPRRERRAYPLTHTVDDFSR
jgi:hypothetical protein